MKLINFHLKATMHIRKLPLYWVGIFDIYHTFSNNYNQCEKLQEIFFMLISVKIVRVINNDFNVIALVYLTFTIHFQLIIIDVKNFKRYFLCSCRWKSSKWSITIFVVRRKTSILISRVSSLALPVCYLVIHVSALTALPKVQISLKADPLISACYCAHRYQPVHK